jgi:hypothetical protein
MKIVILICSLLTANGLFLKQTPADKLDPQIYTWTKEILAQTLNMQRLLVSTNTENEQDGILGKGPFIYSEL